MYTRNASNRNSEADQCTVCKQPGNMATMWDAQTVWRAKRKAATTKRRERRSITAPQVWPTQLANAIRNTGDGNDEKKTKALNILEIR